MKVQIPKSSKTSHITHDKRIPIIRRNVKRSTAYYHLRNQGRTRKTKLVIARAIVKSFLIFALLCIVVFGSRYINIPIVSHNILKIWPRISAKAYSVTYKTINMYIPEELKPIIGTKIQAKLLAIEYKGTKRFKFVSNKSDADVIMQVTTQKPEKYLTEGVFVPVGHMYWIKDGISMSKLSQVYTSSDNAKLLNMVLGSSKSTSKIKVISQSNLLSKLKASENTPGFIRLSQLNAQYKLLTLDDSYFLDSLQKGAIKYYITLASNKTDTNKNASDSTKLAADIFESNGFKAGHLPSKNEITKVNMTGVTAITRSLAIKINRAGKYNYPALKIASFLKDADLTHTSNEVSFVPGCRAATGTRFCSKPEYADALKAIGLDIIELTGNHNNDYGDKWNTWSINNVYKKNKWSYFGGGLNAKDAAKILYKEVKGTKLAFIGYNYYDTMLNTHAIAGGSWAGANSFSFSKMQNDIKTARKNADIVIVDFQFQECYAYPRSDRVYPICYKPLGYPDQKAVFRKAIDNGADIVIGTQAHQPQTYEIYKGKTIFYGLGNLFFDQTPWIGTRQGLILTHYFYNGKHVQTKITTTLYGSAMQPYVTHGKDRELLLKLLKEARR